VRIKMVTLGFVLFCVASAATHASPAEHKGGTPAQKERARYTITDVRAFLFYDRVAKLGQRNVAEAYPEAFSKDRGTPRDLYDAMSGSEVEDGPSNFVLAVATLVKPTFLSYKATGHLKVVAKSQAGKILFSETRGLDRTGSASADSEHNVPFLIPFTWCGPIILEVDLYVRDLGVLSTANVKRVIPFLCRE
jgi:hypothetical protein